MSLMTWYHPSFTGDLRLEAVDPSVPDGDCVLTAVDPTPRERDTLAKFLTHARKKGWVDPLLGVAETGETRLVLGTDVSTAGRKLAGWHWRRKGVITAVRSHDGEMEVVTGDAVETTSLVKQKKAKKAVTSRRPNLCCPKAVEGPLDRASEVLRDFCTDSQWRTWEADGYLDCFGGYTAHRYRIWHRHHPDVRGRWIARDIDDDAQVHCYDWFVPPPEEVLAAKLVLEHREDWIRNPSGILEVLDYSDGASQVFANPFTAPGMDYLDGVRDAALYASIGQMVEGIEVGMLLAKAARGEHLTRAENRTVEQFIERLELGLAQLTNMTA